jgi:hypothetical protein
LNPSWLGGVEDMAVIPQQSLITVNEDPMGEGEGKHLF